jgi:folate-binding protein YgfZ
MGNNGHADGHAVQSDRYGLPGLDVWIPAGNPLPPIPVSSLSAEDAESLRILQKVPAWPNELNGDVFPPEAGLEKTAMSFTKGCYIGQEILSRIKTTGKMPRELVAWEALNGSNIPANTPLVLNSREIGRITSVTRHPLTGHMVGLAYVRQGSTTGDVVTKEGCLVTLGKLFGSS